MRFLNTHESKSLKVELPVTPELTSEAVRWALSEGFPDEEIARCTLRELAELYVYR